MSGAKSPPIRGEANRARPDDATWDARIASFPEGTIFHTRLWARILRASFPALEDRSRAVEGKGGGVLFPLHAWKRAGGLLTTVHSSFPFLYGGAVPARAADGAESLPHALQGLSRWASVRVTGNPFATTDTARSSRDTDLRVDENMAEHGGESEGQDAGRGGREAEAAGAAAVRPAPPAFPAVPGFRAEVDTTHLMRLPETEEGFWDGVLTTSKRNDVRRLGKKGVEVAESRDRTDVAAVYRLYLASFARWGGRPRLVYPEGFYQALLAHGGEAVRLTVARHEEKLLGGTFTLRWNGKVHYLAGYFDHESRALRPNVLLQVESILRAIRDGYLWYDFLPSGGHAPVEEFKESFGGRRTAYPVYVRTGRMHRMVGRKP